MCIRDRFRFEEGKGFLIDPVWPEDKVIELYNREIEYLRSMLGKS